MRRIQGVIKNPIIHRVKDEKNMSVNRFAILCFALSHWPAPAYCDTKAKPAIAKPAPKLIIVQINGKETVGAETASLPNLPSQNVSVRL